MTCLVEAYVKEQIENGSYVVKYCGPRESAVSRRLAFVVTFLVLLEMIGIQGGNSRLSNTLPELSLYTDSLIQLC